MCDNSEVILGYVYGELPEAARHELEGHLQVCAACREEVTGLRATRAVLTTWTPPEPEFAFRIVREPHQQPVRQRFRFTPAWGFAAAAVVVLAAATAIANLEVRYDVDGFAIRSGWGATAGSSQAIAAAPAPGAVFDAKVVALETRIAELEERLRQAPRAVETVSAPAIGSRLSEADLRVIRDIVRQSETRQQRETTMQIGQVVRDVDRAREMDFKLVQSAIAGQLRGATSAEVANQLNHFLRVNQK